MREDANYIKGQIEPSDTRLFVSKDGIGDVTVMRRRAGSSRQRFKSVGFSEPELRSLLNNGKRQAFMDVRDASRPGSEIWIAGKDPTAMLPRPTGVCIQPAPQGSAADLSHQALRHYLLLDIGDGESREGESQTMRKLTGEGLSLNDDAGRKRGRDGRTEVARPGRADASRQVVCATCSRSAGTCPSTSQ